MDTHAPGPWPAAADVSLGDRLSIGAEATEVPARSAEARADAILQASAAILDGLGRIGEGGDADLLLGTILATIADRLGEDGGGVWLYDEARDLLRLQINLTQGRIESRKASGHPGALLEEGGQHERSRAAHNVRYKSSEAMQFGPDILYGDPTWEPYQDYFRAAGVRSLLSVPLFAGPAFLGCVTIRATRHDRFSPSDVAFAQAMTNQAAIGLHIHRLGETARAAAIARERADAATRRAEVLARANAAIRSSLDRLSEAQDIAAFLGESAVVCARELGAVGAGIWVRGGDTNLHTLVVSYEDGEIRRGDRIENPAIQRDSDNNYPIMRRGEIAVDAGDDLRAKPWYPAYRDYLETRGIVAIVSVPLFIGERWIGAVVLRHTAPPDLPPEARELAHALANQIALALEFTRLANAAREAAVVREREAAARARAEKLAAANRLLRESAERLGAIEDIDAFLGEVLLTITTLLGGHSATVWTNDAASDSTILQYVVEDGVAIPAAASGHPNAHAPRRNPANAADIMPGFGTTFVRPYQARIDANLGFDERERAYFAALGVVSLVTVPMVIAGEHLGTFTIRLRDDRPLLDDDRELIHALANQASVALHLTRLADAAREAAVVREREAAARARAEKLAAANRLLRESAERLGAIEDIDAFLGQVLLTIVDLLEVRSGTVWTEDAARRVAHLRYVVDNGIPIPAACSRHPNAVTPAPHPDDDPMQARGTAAAQPLIIDVADLKVPEATKEYIRAGGSNSLLAAPMVFAGEHIGTFTVRLTGARALDVDDRELIQALANQAAVALHLTRLAEQAREAAVARAKEEAASQRAAELAKANAALAGSIATLSAEGDLDAYLGGMLRILLDQMGSDSGSLWCVDSEGWYRLHTEVVDGCFRPLAESDHPGAKFPVSAANRGNPIAQRSQRMEAVERRPLVYSDVATAPEYDGEEATRAYLLSIGVKAQLIVPMFSGDRHLGSFSVRSPVARSWSAEQIELAEALSNQAALAIEVSRLSGEARDAAIAREHERLAEQRAADLAQSTEAIQRTLRRLTERPDLDVFLLQVLSEAAKTADAHANTLFTADAATRTFSMRAFVRGGEDWDVATHPGLAVWREPVPWDEAPGAVDVFARGEAVMIDVRLGTDDPSMWPRSVAFLRGLGCLSVLSLPLLLGDRLVGFMGLLFTDAVERLPSRIETVRAFATQATLALELTRLAAEAREMAAAQAREASAQARADKIAAANRLLRGAVGDVDALLGRVLLSISELLGGQSAALWTVDAQAGESRLRYVVEGGAAVPAAASAHPNAQAGVVVSETSQVRAGYGSGSARPFQFSVSDTPLLTGEQRAYFERLGVRSVVSLPLVLNDEHFGEITIRLGDVRPVLDEDYELIQTLANQAALALHLTRSAAEARRSALIDERNRMAREIHDTLAQGFAAIALQLQAAERAEGGSAGAGAEPLAIARRLAHDNLIEARRSLDLLKSGRGRTLAEGLAQLIDSMRRAGEARVETDLKPAPEPPLDVGHELLRIVQEALTNAVRHADARRITLRLWPSGAGGVTLRVADDGGGFDPDISTSGFGLAGMRDRALAIGAVLTVISEAGAGTEVVVSWQDSGCARQTA